MTGLTALTGEVIRHKLMCWFDTQNDSYLEEINLVDIQKTNISFEEDRLCILVFLSDGVTIPITTTKAFAELLLDKLTTPWNF